MDPFALIASMTEEDLLKFTESVWQPGESGSLVDTEVADYSLDAIMENPWSDNTFPGTLDMVAQRPASADGTRPANKTDSIVFPLSRAQSCPSLAMSKIHSVQSRPAPWLASSGTSAYHEEVPQPPPSVSSTRFKTTPLLAISKISVCYEEVPEPDTLTTSLAERKDTIPGVSITSLGVGLDPVGASPVPPISTDNVVVKPTPLAVDIGDSVDYAVQEESRIYSEPAMKSTSSTSKHTAGSEQIARAPPTVRDHSNVLCSKAKSVSSSSASSSSDSSDSSDSSHVSRSRTSSRTIDFEELKRTAAAASVSKPSNEGCAGNTTVTQGISPKLSKSTSSTSSALSASDPDSSKAMMSESGNVRNGLSGSSGGHRIKKNKPLPRDQSSLKDHGDSPDDAIVVDDTSDDDHGETAQQNPDEHRDLMELAYLDEGQALTEKDAQPTLNSNQRRPLKRARLSPLRPGFIQWKGPVDSRLETFDNLWLRTQTEWMSLHHDTERYTGPLMISFDKRIRSAAEKFLSGGFCASDVLTLQKSWLLTYTVALTQLEEIQHKKQIKQFKMTLEELWLKSRGLQKEDFTMEKNNEGDTEWTPGTKSKRRRVE
ncbi:hypothetical protein G6011_00773 [Alternaria panax]|uniref:Uncharacterized protein n=1 Tax=Alternaria panax TaxID=48097 RepID=A0AAD4NV12_9PLEO|nr:hypothetical protein G6011_00773 [Alternaria panax]